MTISRRHLALPLLGTLAASSVAEKGERMYAQATARKKTELFEAAYLEFQIAYAMNPTTRFFGTSR